MMTGNELRSLYESVVKQSGHPDPVGYMARALAFSDANPDYMDIEGKQGFMPVHPDRALKEVGAKNVSLLENNVPATLAMDMLYFDQFGRIEDMIVAFHEGIDAVGNPSDELRELLDNLPELRQSMIEIIAPRLATVDDVISILTKTKPPNTNRLDAFKQILRSVN